MTAPSESGRRAWSVLNSAVNPAEVASADSGFRLVTFALRPAAGGHPVRGNSRCPLASLLFGIFLHLIHLNNLTFPFVPFLPCVCTGGAVPSGLEENLCKICMDSPIDCVLLECGHMVTCTKCGKRMNECPICRQYVIRAVHVFRS